jgi:peptidoglycan/LPS O-acetylase OafA/YrhL
VDNQPSSLPQVATIPALTGLRIVAASWVVLEHFRNPIAALLHPAAAPTALISSGYLGVEVFFVLSGFIISHNYASRLTPWNAPEYRRFLRLRFARLYPVHLFTFVAAGGLLLGAHIMHVALNSAPSTSPLSAIMNLFMLQAVPPAHGWDQPAWSICCEAGAYLAFPVMALLLVRCRTRLKSLSGVLVGVTFTVTALILLSSAGVLSTTSYPAMWARILGEFSAGCFLWAFWDRFVKPRRAWDAVAVASGGTVAILACLLRGPAWTSIATLPLLALLVIATASATGPVSRILGHRVAVYGGKISYSLYMTHFLVLMVVGKLLPWEHASSAPLLTRLGILTAYAALVLLAAMLTYHWVEEPARRALSPRQRAAGSADLDVAIPAPRSAPRSDSTVQSVQ